MRLFLFFICMVVWTDLFAYPYLVWTKKYGGEWGDVLYACAVDPAGYYIVGGLSSYGFPNILKLDPATGDTIWGKFYRNPRKIYACAVDTAGYYVFVGKGENPAGYPDDDAWILKINPSTGDTIWAKSYGINNFRDEAYACAIDSSGYYIVGGVIEADPSADAGGKIWVLKIDPSTGDTVWSKIYEGPYSSAAHACAVDPSGYYIVAGSGGDDFWILKLNPSTGDTIWSKMYGGAGEDIACGCAIDPSGYYIIAGYTNSYSANGYDFWVAKLDTSGDTIWTRIYDSGGSEQAYACAVDLSGCYIVVGQNYSFDTGDINIWILKLDPMTGDTIWTKLYGEVESDAAFDCAVDLCYYLVVGYTRNNTAGYEDFWILKIGEDTVPPVINYVSQVEDDTTAPYGPYDVYAKITDNNSQISIASIYWKRKGDASFTASAMQEEDTIWHGIIPQQPYFRQDTLIFYYVYARDNAGNLSVSDTFSFWIKPDTIPPVINGITKIENDTTAPYGPYDVYAKITDNQAVKEAFLYWCKGKDTLFFVDTLTKEDTIWHGVIPQQISPDWNTLILYYICASDSALNLTTSDTFSFYVRFDTLPPVINNVTELEDDTIIPYGPYDVYAEIKDNVSVEEAFLYWRRNQDTLFFADTMQKEDTIWHAVIPEQISVGWNIIIFYYVYARDSAGNIGMSDTFSFSIKPDTIPPLIKNVSQIENDTIAPYGPYNIYAKITDNKSVTEALLYWKKKGDSLFVVDTMHGDTIRCGVIPEQVSPPWNTVIFYYVYAKDVAENNSISDTYSFWIKPDTISPIIDSVTHLDNDTGEPYGPYYVWAKVIDNKVLKNVILYWKNEDFPVFIATNMEFASNNWWYGQISRMEVTDSSKVSYFVQVEDSAGNKSLSDTLSFWLIHGINEAKSGISIKVPSVSRRITVNVNSPSISDFNIEIFSVDGRKICEEEKRTSGKYVYNLKVPAGIYFVKIKVNEINLRRKVIIVR